MAEYTITRRNGDRYVVLVDDADISAVQEAGPWCVSRGSHAWYVARRAGSKLELLHRWLLCAATGTQVDHINRDTLDNRRENLRLCSQGENNQNRGRQSNNKSGLKGVYLDGRTGRYQAQLKLKGLHLSLGCYQTKEEAHAAYCRAARETYGEFFNPG